MDFKKIAEELITKNNNRWEFEAIEEIEKALKKAYFEAQYIDRQTEIALQRQAKEQERNRILKIIEKEYVCFCNLLKKKELPCRRCFIIKKIKEDLK
jgi:hypothetical protein